MTAQAAEASRDKPHRGTIFVEDAEVVAIDEYDGEQFVIRLHAPRCAERAMAGSFVHIQCNPDILMRRPLSIMRADGDAGWIDVLFKTVGPGLRALSQVRKGDAVSIIGPIGKGFTPHTELSRPLLIGGGVGIPPMVFLAEQLKGDVFEWQTTVLMGSEIPFPFDRRPAKTEASWLNDEINSTMPLLDDWGIATRLATLAGYDGCFSGYVTDLARAYLDNLSAEERAKVEIFSCGPTPMLKAVADLAREYDLPCQVSLEEFMACAVGGCAGCAVEVQTADGPAMKRVCVDGPVFDSAAVFPAG